MESSYQPLSSHQLPLLILSHPLISSSVRTKNRATQTTPATVIHRSMASITMTASFIGTVKTAERPPMNRRLLTVAKMANTDGAETSNKASSNRRDLMFAAAAAAICSVASGHGAALAGVEPSPGTPEAKKKYTAVCVTMPTARICHK